MSFKAFAFYRQPHARCCYLVGQSCGQPQELLSCAHLHAHSGFVLAPFAVSSQTPLLLIEPDVYETIGFDAAGNAEREPCDWFMRQGACLQQETDRCCEVLNPRSDYARSFGLFHSQLTAGTLRKVVLSRCLTVHHADSVTPWELFLRACKLYPRLFIALVYTPQSGCWLTATPEVLLEQVDTQWHTIALAGTMKLEGSDLLGEGEQARWSAKNIEEQRVVATYIAEQLKPYAQNLQEEGPRTVRAANLVHLRSDFFFSLIDGASVGDILQSLHPTPAVCGIPKREAFSYIVAHEPSPRLYYSGFMGPLNLSQTTHLYVSLRCMQVTTDTFRLYAGGGLLKESVEEQEWQETEAKLETMKRCIAIKTM